MSLQEWSLIAIIGVASFLIITERMRADLVALLVLLALVSTGLVDSTEALSGFSRSAVITIMGLFIMSAALDQTGVTQWIADVLTRGGIRSEARFVLLVLLLGASLSLIMSGTAIGVLLLLPTISAARRAGIAPSRVLLPLAFSTLLGGMATYFTTANILVSSALSEHKLVGFGILDFAPTGGLVAIAGIAYIALIGRHHLPIRLPIGETARHQNDLPLDQTYQVSRRFWELLVLPKSPLAGRTVSDCQIGKHYGLTLVALTRNQRTQITPTPEEIIHTGDILTVVGPARRVQQIAKNRLHVRRSPGLSSGKVASFEAVVAPRAQVEGRSLKEINFRRKFGLTVLAIWREGRSHRKNVAQMPLRFGDALLLVGDPARTAVLRDEPDFVVLAENLPSPQPGRKAVTATVILGLVLTLSIFNILPLAESILLGVVLLVLTRCISMDESYRAIEWRVIFMLAGMLPLSIAVGKSGLAAQMGLLVSSTLGPYGPLVMVGGLYLFTVLITQFLGGQVTAVIFTPIAISTAEQLKINPHAASMAVAIACSTCFLTPFGHSVNLLMMGPGNYKFGDFFKIGIGLTLVCFIALLIGLKLMWRL